MPFNALKISEVKALTLLRFSSTIHGPLPIPTLSLPLSSPKHLIYSIFKL